VPGQTARVEPTDITAGRLHLRPWQAGDEQVLLAFADDADSVRWTNVPSPYTSEHARAWVHDTAPSGWESGSALSFAVCDSTTAAVLASTRLLRGREPGVWDVGYWCLPEHRGQGVVPEALGAVCRWAFAVLDAQRIEWKAEVGNRSSRRAAEKAGFRVEGVLRGGLLHRGAPVDGWIGGLLPGDPMEDVAQRPLQKVELRTERLLLRPWQEGDLPALELALADPEVTRWTPLHPERARSMVEQAEDRWHDGRAVTFAVLDAASRELLGSVGLHHVVGTEAEVGWWCALEARGRGVTAEALSALCRWALSTAGLHRLTARIQVGNWPSRALAEKVGFSVEGVLRDHAAGPDRRADMWIAGLLASDEQRDRRLLPSYEEQSDGVVTLRRWRPTDAADVARACADAEIARWLPVPVPYTVEAGLGYVDGIVPAEWAAGTNANVAVVDAGDGALLGAAGLRLRDGIGEVGYWTAPEARGRGVAGRAARLHSDWGLTVLGLPRVELLADVDNVASQRAADRAGFTREGVARALRPAPRDPGTRRDMIVYARVPGDA
jgi:RimJ/RimL family protein N-acetyltransferase